MKSVPRGLQEAASVHGFDWWSRRGTRVPFDRVLALVNAAERLDRVDTR